MSGKDNNQDNNQRRLPRYKRCEAAAIRVTERDVEIVRAIAKHHFLSSKHIAMLVDGSGQQLRRRLQLLFHHGFLERPRAQLEYFNRAGSQPMVYGLGNRGARLLAGNDNLPHDKVDWSYKNSKIRREFLEHTLGIAEVMIAFELACRQEKGITFIDQSQILKEAPEVTKNKRNPLRFVATVKIKSKRERLALVPDQVFALEYETEGGVERANFFLELDRGTMPVERRSLRGSSIYKKLLTYHAGWQQNRHAEQFGWSRFRVLTVTNSPERVEHMASVAKRFNNGRGSRLFLFADANQIDQCSTFETEWRDGCGGETRLRED